MAGDDRWQAGEASGSCARSWCLPELGCSTSAWASPRCVPSERHCSSQPETRPRGAQTRRRPRPTTLCAFCRGRSRQSCTLISPLGEDSNRIHRQYGVWVQVRITKRDGEYFTHSTVQVVVQMHGQRTNKRTNTTTSGELRQFPRYLILIERVLVDDPRSFDRDSWCGRWRSSNVAALSFSLNTLRIDASTRWHI